ncbi:MAG: glycoside hydrolase family 92 protein, partial [Bacteroidales bacterium]|nr:glycoside hydrolase family 92 protein [Bacteroidales bacterium]MBN2775665.1 glycoside hydrolase family 92 protein [Prolixibacteraceae bacterium]
VPVVVDAFLKGFNGFDPDLAFEAVTTSATLPAQNGVPYILDRGFIPCDSVREATSIAMEYAVDDDCIALMADKLNKTEEYKIFAEHAGYYKTYFDKSIHFIRPKMADGSWRTPYGPFTSVHMVGDFTEGNGWQYTFFAPHDPEGLIELFGGDEAFTAKLDSFFIVEGDMGEQASADITGLIGMYAHGNEPSHHIAYLYAFAGQQWKTAQKVRYIMEQFYTSDMDGLIGNEDCGQMSAWYVMSSLGFYPVHPANGVYVFGSPLLDKAIINFRDGKSFTIESIDNSKENIYIQTVELNEEKYNKSFITFSDITKGGSLKFYMGPEPNYEFGADKSERPVSGI